jgi:hypothetical protein
LGLDNAPVEVRGMLSKMMRKIIGLPMDIRTQDSVERMLSSAGLPH